MFAGSAEYNGVHLRIEKDAEPWALILGGRKVLLARYLDAMRRAKFDSKTTLYVASGLLTYKGGPKELRKVIVHD